MRMNEFMASVKRNPGSSVCVSLMNSPAPALCFIPLHCWMELLAFQGVKGHRLSAVVSGLVTALLN